MRTAINSRIGIALLIVAACPLCGCLTTAPGYETTDFHANGTPVTAEEKAEQNRRHQQECRRLYLLLGDRSLTPAQIAEVRLKRNAMFCIGEGP
jgi:hypothetical protein